MAERVLVTGAAGFIGSHLVDALLARGDRVLGVDNFDDFYDPAIKRANIAGARCSSAFTMAEADVRDPAALGAAMDEIEPDVVVHMAARAGVRPSIAAPALYADVNVRGTAALLDAARARGISRVVVASSSSVYGNASRVPFSEADAAISPVSPYAATKRAAELLCETFAGLEPRLRIVSLRFFTVYGPRQRPDLAIHKFAALISSGRPIPVYGDGSSSRDYTYVTDTVQGVLGAIERTRDRAVRHEVYNLGESQTTTLRELIALLEDALGQKATIDRLPPQAGDVSCTYADISRARDTLGYAPAVPIRDGIPRFVAWFRDTAGRGAAALR
ncbi:MAG TPA: NAD-dependent epimerase/dehydratase family protein [Gemmatimonadaceae bacterium]|nr:NAD-dependent epimerase/dehydratase family protein [Gemmatimonadaceae bacterium]